MKINNKFWVMLILSIVILFPISMPCILALTAESDDYSIGRFSAGMSASKLDSDTLTGHAVSSSNSGGETQNSLFQGIIGFFGIFKGSDFVSYEVIINQTEIVQAGNVYSITIEVINSSGSVEITSSPKITIYDPLENLIVDNVSATLISNKKYQYNLTTNLVDVAGIKEIYINLGINGVAKEYNKNWTLSNGHTEISINSINISSSPTIKANITITNEDSSAYEYPYEYCIVSVLTQQCGNSNNIAYASGYKLLNASESWNTTLSLNIAQSGNYWFKIVAHYGTQNSGATRSFSASYTPQAIIDSGSGSSSGGSGASNQPTTINIQEGTIVSNQQVINGIIAKFEANEKLIISLQSSNSKNIEAHTISMFNIGTNNITIVISSNPVILQLSIGEAKEIDIDGDGIKDIYFKLNKINNGEVDLLIKQIISKSSSITGATISYPKHLMDVSTRILDEYKIIHPGDKVLMEVTLYNLGTEEIKDAQIRYCIETNNKEIVKCSEEAIAIYTKLQLIKEFLISPDIETGEYFIKTEVLYDNNSKASSETSFEVKRIIFSARNNLMINYLLSLSLGIVILMLLIVIILIYKKRKLQIGSRHYIPSDKNYSIIEKKVHQDNINSIRKVREVKPEPFEETEIKGDKYLEIKPSSTANIEHKGDKSSEIPFSEKDEIPLQPKKCFENLWNKHKKYPQNSILGLINKRVYSESGYYLGKVNDIILGKNNISNLKIELDKRYNFKARGIVIDYKQVKNAGEVIIVDELVSEHLKEFL